MKRRIAEMVTFLLIACLMLTGCGTGGNASETITEQPAITEEAAGAVKPAEEGRYTYNVGETVLTLRTRVEDYITVDGRFRFIDLANDLGWSQTVSKFGPTSTVYCETEGGPVALYYDPGRNDVIERIVFGVAKTTYPLNWSSCSELVFNYDDEAKLTEYVVDVEEPMKVHLGHIVATAYILENYARDRSEAFFDGYFERSSPSMWQVYE